MGYFGTNWIFGGNGFLGGSGYFGRKVGFWEKVDILRQKWIFQKTLFNKWVFFVRVFLCYGYDGSGLGQGLMF